MSGGYRSRNIAHSAKRSLLIFVAATAILVGCGGQEQEPPDTSDDSMSEESMMEESMMEESMMSENTSAGEPTGGMERTTDDGTSESSEIAQLELGLDEEANMLPARGIREEEARPLPEDPPEGINISDPTTNRATDDPIEYDTSDGLPPTNGDHDTFWKNCGYYDEPVENRYAVHSLDHGAVWITYSQDLPADQIETLRSYATEPYVLVSPFPDQSSPVAVTSWRLQLPLDSASDPRLDQFVQDFRVSELSPLSGNGCVGGNGEPLEAAPESVYREES